MRPHDAEKRMRALAKAAVDIDPDVIVLQEATKWLLSILLNSCHHDTPCGEECDEPWSEKYFVYDGDANNAHSPTRFFSSDEDEDDVFVKRKPFMIHYLVIMSKIPLVAFQRNRFPETSTRRYMMEGVYICPTTGLSLRICNIHLESLPKNKEIRTAQLRYLFRRFSNLCMYPTLIIGDFNILREDPEPRIPKPYRDLWLTQGSFHDEGFTYNGTTNFLARRGFESRLDRAYWRPHTNWNHLSQKIEMSLITSYQVSDHYGILVVIN